MNVSFIGSGNVAWHLAPALDNTDYPVKEVYSYQRANATALAGKLYQAVVKEGLDFSDSPSRIFVVAVSDDAINEVVQQLVLPPDAILIHTSGSQPLSILEDSNAAMTGVLYPLQTLSRNRKLDLKEVPFFVEGSDKGAEDVLTRMAKAIAQKVQRISSSQRLALHVAAVFASNFTNHLITLSKDIADDHKLDFGWLKPLIAETINKSMTLGPERAQTGPAKRGDLQILDRHMEFLADDEALGEIYRVISQHIVDRYVE